jgi:hypothetical protein
MTFKTAAITKGLLLVNRQPRGGWLQRLNICHWSDGFGDGFAEADIDPLHFFAVFMGKRESDQDQYEQNDNNVSFG